MTINKGTISLPCHIEYGESSECDYGQCEGFVFLIGRIVTVHAFYPPVADFLSPLQGLKNWFASLPKAVALGYSILPFQGE